MIQELQNFRTKYPGYDDLDDLTLVTKLSEKYPEYTDLLDKVKSEQLQEQPFSMVKETMRQLPRSIGQTLMQAPIKTLTDAARMINEPLEAGKLGAIKNAYDTISGLIKFSQKQFEDIPKLDPEFDKFVSNLTQKAKQKFLQSDYYKQKERVMKEHPVAAKVGEVGADIGLLVAASAIPGSADDIAVITKLATKYPKIALAIKGAVRSGKTLGIFGFTKELAKTQNLPSAVKEGIKSGTFGALVFGAGGAIENPVIRGILQTAGAHTIDKISSLRAKHQRGEEITLKDVLTPSLSTIMIAAFSVIGAPAHQRAIKAQRQAIMKAAKQELYREPKSYKEAVETLKKAERVILPGGKEISTRKAPDIAVWNKATKSFIKPEGKIVPRGSKMVDVKGKEVYEWDKTFKEYRPVITQAGKAPKVVEIKVEKKVPFKVGEKEQILKIAAREKVTLVRAREIAKAQIKPTPTVKAPVVKPEKAIVSKIPRLQKMYEKVMSKIPQNIRKDVDIKGLQEVKFPLEYEGEGGRLEFGKDETHFILLEKGEKNVEDTLLHEILHSYVDKHPEVTDKSKGYFAYEDAVNRLYAQATVKVEKPAEVVKAPSGMATVGIFRKDTEVKLGKIDKIKPVEFPELVELTKDLMGRVPQVSKRLRTSLGKFYGTERGRIKLTPEIFKKENSDQLAKVLAHEIGHLVDYLPQQTLRRGNLLGSLLSMRRFLKNTYGVVNITNKELRNELKSVSNYWRPWDESKATASFKNYRNSSRELYADSISILLNNPGKLEQIAPQFYKSFFEHLDKKPEVKDAYFKLQEVLSHDRETLIELRRERVREMFSQADHKSGELQKIKEKERELRLKDFWEMFTYGVKSVNQPVYRKVETLRKRGVHIPDEENPEYLLSGRNYLSGLVKGEFKQNIQPIMKNLLENDIDWKTFGEFLYYDRIVAGDRSEFANPRGITPKAAEELSASIKESLGSRYKILEDNANKFRGFLKGLSEKAYKEGMFTKEMFDIVKGNEKYVPFQVVEYMENYVAWKTKPQVGTLKDITNPANSLLLKAVSTIRAIERQKIRKATFKMLEDSFPDEIQDAKLQFTGKAQRPIPSRDPKLEMVTYYKEGKLRGKYVDPYIAKSLENDTIATNKAVMTLLSPVRYLNRKLFRPLFVVYNPGWIPFNFIRDFDRAWKNIPGMSMYRLLKLYGKAIRPAKVRAFGLKEKAKEADIKAEKLITKLEKEEILSITWNDFLMGQTTEDVQIETIFEQMGLAESKKEIPAIVKGFETVLEKTGIKPLLEWVRDAGSMVETLSKVAGYYELEGKMSPQEMRTFLRRNVGSPDFFEKGYLTAATNDVFLFSNAFIQAVSADTNIAISPKTRSGFWWKTAKVAFLPKLLMFLALAGAFGKKIKDMMSDASEYDLTNYTVIPIGRDSKNGKTIYLRIPTDESSRLLGGVMWKGMNSFKNNQPFMRDMADVASLFGGQLPGLSPSIEVPLSTAQFLTGKNPYDSFRGRLALSKKEMDAGGWYATKPFLMWQFQQMGGNVFMKLYAGERTPTEKSIGEKVLRSPIISNVIGRFVKISDYGSIERYRKTTDIVKQKRARKSIDENRILSDYVGKYQKKEGTERDLLDKMAIDIIGHRPKSSKEASKKRRLAKKFKIAILRGRSDPVLNAFISAWTNDEKLELLKVFREDMSELEFKELGKTLRKHSIVSSDVFNRLRRK